MNPFDLRGPEFLVFYALLTAAVIAVLFLLRRALESESAPPRADLADPYLIAYLRGGEHEAMRVAVVSLVDRKLLVATGTELKRADHATTDSVRKPLEKALLRKFAKTGDVSWIFDDQMLKDACEEYRLALQNRRLLPDDSIERARRKRFVVALLILLGVGGIKIVVALSRGRTNITFLVILMVVAVALATKVSFPRLTARGAAMLEDVRTLYGGLKDRALSIRPGGATVEAAMLAAVFGVGALAGDAYAYTTGLFPRVKSSSSSSGSSSCGSSCGSSSDSSSGSSCGGGGCGGGCGGCGS